jgi:hypothetical protein
VARSNHAMRRRGAARRARARVTGAHARRHCARSGSAVTNSYQRAGRAPARGACAAARPQPDAAALPRARRSCRDAARRSLRPARRRALPSFSPGDLDSESSLVLRKSGTGLQMRPTAAAHKADAASAADQLIVTVSSACVCLAARSSVRASVMLKTKHAPTRLSGAARAEGRAARRRPPAPCCARLRRSPHAQLVRSAAAGRRGAAAAGRTCCDAAISGRGDIRSTVTA